jgi:hypothetical protein
MTYAGLITVPSMTTPVVAYYHIAFRSVRASATTIGFLMRPLLRRARSQNYRLRGDLG